MIQLLYTSSIEPNKIQQNPLNSLGGFVSSSLISNGEKNSLFSDIIQGNSKNSRQVILIALVNASASILNDVEVFIDSTNVTLCTVKTSVVEGYLDNCQRLKFEQIVNSSSLPMYADLQIHDSTNKIIIPQMAPGKTLGLWLLRELTQTGEELVNDLVSCENLSKNLSSTFNLGDHSLRINW